MTNKRETVIGLCVLGISVTIVVVILTIARRSTEWSIGVESGIGIQTTENKQPVDHVTLAEPAQDLRVVPPVVPAEAPTDRNAHVRVEEEKSRAREMRGKMEQRALNEKWLDRYAGATATELAGQRDELEAAILSMTREYFESQFSIGSYELFNETDPALTALRNNPFLICWKRYEPGDGRTKVVVLPEDQFPELYHLRELSTWLSLRLLNRPTLVESK